MGNFLTRVGRGLLRTWEVFNFVLREMVGWLLILLALAAGYQCYLWIQSDRPKVVSAALLTPLTIFCFRGGIHFLKVSIAARIALQARKTETKS